MDRYRQYGFGEAVKSAFVRAFDFSGRSRRSEYWWFYLFTLISGIVFGALDLGLYGLGLYFEYGYFAFSVIFFFPSLSILTRRLHDTGRSGWFGAPYWAYYIYDILLLFDQNFTSKFFSLVSPNSGSVGITALVVAAGFVLVIWVIFIFILTLSDSHRDLNRYGPSPKYASIEDTFE